MIWTRFSYIGRRYYHLLSSGKSVDQAKQIVNADNSVELYGPPLENIFLQYSLIQSLIAMSNIQHASRAVLVYGQCNFSAALQAVASPNAWLCGYDEAVKGMEARGVKKTDIETEYFPSVCRL